MTTKTEAWRHLKSYIIFVNVVFTLIPMLVKTCMPDYMFEDRLFTDSYFPIFNYAIGFDGLIFITNNYQWQSNFAFLPGFVYLIKFIKLLLKVIVSNPDSLIVPVIVIINKAITLFACLTLYQITLYFGSKTLSKGAAILFLFSPSGIFYNSVYSQPLFALFTLEAIRGTLAIRKQSEWVIHEPAKFISLNIKSLVLFSLSITIRTTGLFLSLIYGLPILIHLFLSLNKKNFRMAFNIAVTGACTLAFFIIPFLLYLLFGYITFCTGETVSPFCYRTFPNIYSYVEDKFWEVGFLRYYQTGQGQIFSIIMGLLSVFCAFWTSVFNSKKLYTNSFTLGLLISYALIGYITAFYANAQSGTRFFSTHPIFYINIASYMERRNGKKHFSTMQLLFLMYFTFYNVAGTIFFSKRLTWA